MPFWTKQTHRAPLTDSLESALFRPAVELQKKPLSTAFPLPIQGHSGAILRRMTSNTSELHRIVASLKGSGLSVELLEDGAMVHDGESRVALFAESDEQGGVLVRLHLDLDLYVEEDAVADVLVGMNLMNQGLDYGTLMLDPVEDEEDEDKIAFAVLGRSVLWLPDLDGVELRRLREHLRRFETEVTEAVERTLQGDKGMKA
jgi:hypothetical protein